MNQRHQAEQRRKIGSVATLTVTSQCGVCLWGCWQLLLIAPSCVFRVWYKDTRPSPDSGPQNTENWARPGVCCSFSAWVMNFVMLMDNGHLENILLTIIGVNEPKNVLHINIIKICDILNCCIVATIILQKLQNSHKLVQRNGTLRLNI